MIQYGRVGRSFHRHHYHGDVLKNAGNDDLLLLLFCFFLIILGPQRITVKPTEFVLSGYFIYTITKAKTQQQQLGTV